MKYKNKGRTTTQTRHTAANALSYKKLGIEKPGLEIVESGWEKGNS
jgi:hypothetical protein